MDNDGARREEERMALDVVDSEGYVAPPTKDVQGLASAAPRKIRRKVDLLFHPSALFGGPYGPRLDCSHDVTGSETCEASSALKYDLCVRRIVEPVALALARTRRILLTDWSYSRRGTRFARVAYRHFAAAGGRHEAIVRMGEQKRPVFRVSSL